MEFCTKHYNLTYKPNSRETFRRFSIHQLVQAGIVNYNPDDIHRATNSPKAVYQIAADALALIKTYKTSLWKPALLDYQGNHHTLASTYAKSRAITKIPVTINGKIFKFSTGKHNLLVKAIIEDFAACFLHNSVLVYAGDTADKAAYTDQNLFKLIGIPYDMHNKLPDLIFFLPDKNWLVLVEAVTSHGPMDAKRCLELGDLLKDSTQDLVFISAFPDKATMRKYIGAIAWETEVWIADNPTHLIHFNGSKFLGPYSTI